jgi:hypothetical protein
MRQVYKQQCLENTDVNTSAHTLRRLPESASAMNPSLA